MQLALKRVARANRVCQVTAQRKPDADPQFVPFKFRFSESKEKHEWTPKSGQCSAVVRSCLCGENHHDGCRTLKTSVDSSTNKPHNLNVLSGLGVSERN
ncbi:hypothetical protein BaRGS_00004205 [Batillaria attramentaria]|uniref:Uncharacterized protein n=1 Tax=Batillaria attramentaria TaxID=370345 RepID=A0ABD0LZ43_9CAEN